MNSNANQIIIKKNPNKSLITPQDVYRVMESKRMCVYSQEGEIVDATTIANGVNTSRVNGDIDSGYSDCGVWLSSAEKATELRDDKDAELFLPVYRNYCPKTAKCANPEPLRKCKGTEREVSNMDYLSDRFHWDGNPDDECMTIYLKLMSRQNPTVLFPNDQFVSPESRAAIYKNIYYKPDFLASFDEFAVNLMGSCIPNVDIGDIAMFGYNQRTRDWNSINYYGFWMELIKIKLHREENYWIKIDKDNCYEIVMNGVTYYSIAKQLANPDGSYNPLHPVCPISKWYHNTTIAATTMLFPSKLLRDFAIEYINDSGKHMNMLYCMLIELRFPNYFKGTFIKTQIKTPFGIANIAVEAALSMKAEGMTLQHSKIWSYMFKKHWGARTYLNDPRTQLEMESFIDLGNMILAAWGAPYVPIYDAPWKNMYHNPKATAGISTFVRPLNDADLAAAFDVPTPKKKTKGPKKIAPVKPKPVANSGDGKKYMKRQQEIGEWESAWESIADEKGYEL